MISDKGILYIEPDRSTTSAKPVIDDLTRKMAAAFRQAEKGPAYRGFHVCACGAASSNCSYTLPNGEMTNSLCVHYLAFHRKAVPDEQLEKVAQLNQGLVYPTPEELNKPGVVTVVTSGPPLLGGR